MIDIITWILAIVVAALAITLVYVTMAIVRPVSGTIAKNIVQAKRKNMPVILLDDGGRWVCIVGDNKLSEDFVEDKFGNVVIVPPNTLKYSKGGVLIGVGENHRGITTNAANIPIMEKAINNKWGIAQIKEELSNIQEAQIQLNKESNNGVRKRQTQAAREPDGDAGETGSGGKDSGLFFA